MSPDRQLDRNYDNDDPQAEKDWATLGGGERDQDLEELRRKGAEKALDGAKKSTLPAVKIIIKRAFRLDGN